MVRDVTQVLGKASVTRGFCGQGRAGSEKVAQACSGAGWGVATESPPAQLALDTASWCGGTENRRPEAAVCKLSAALGGLALGVRVWSWQGLCQGSRGVWVTASHPERGHVERGPRPF